MGGSRVSFQEWKWAGNAKKTEKGPWSGLRMVLCLCASTWAVIDGQAKLFIGSPSAFFRFKFGPYIFGAGLIPAPGLVFPLLPFGRGKINGAFEHAFYALGNPPHKIRELAICLHGFAAQSFCCPGSLSLEHRSQTEKFKKKIVA
jgi:hypothetical protein